MSTLIFLNKIVPNTNIFSGVRFERTNKNKTPGPAAYSPADMNVNLRRPPAYSMRGPLEQKRKGVGPGPSHYNTSYYRPGDTPASYSFGIKHNPYAPPMIVACDN